MILSKIVHNRWIDFKGWKKFTSCHWTWEIIEVKVGHLVKSENLVKQKKILFINFLKEKYLLLWPMVNFYQEVAQILDLWSKIQGFEGEPCHREGLKPLNLKWQILKISGGNWPLVIKANIFLSKCLYIRFFFRLTELSLFDQVASFDPNYLPSPITNCKLFQPIFQIRLAGIIIFFSIFMG